MARENKRNRQLRRMALAFEQAGQITRTTQTQIVTSGPLPNPEILRAFDTIKIGFAERIVAMAEDEAKHRRDLETKVIEARIGDRRAHRTEARIGQVLAFVVAITLMGCGTYAITHGAQIAGTILAGSSVTGLVSAFITGRRLSDHDAESSEQQPPEEEQPQQQPREQLPNPT